MELGLFGNLATVSHPLCSESGLIWVFYSGQALVAQIVKGVWSVWLESVRAKTYLADTIGEIDIYGTKVIVYNIIIVSSNRCLPSFYATLCCVVEL